MIVGEKGDLVFTASNTALGAGIRWAETIRGEEPTEVNHVGMVSRRGIILPCAQPMRWEKGDYAHVIESLWRTIEQPWFPNQKPGNEIRIWRYMPITDFQAEIAVQRARKFVGAKYGWWKLFAHLIDNKVLGGKYATRRLLHVDSRPICSYSTASGFAVAGIKTGRIPARAQSPDSIWDYVNDSDRLGVWYEVGRGITKEVA